jgi:hypothetical protein
MKTSKETSLTSNSFELNKEALEDKVQDGNSIANRDEYPASNVVALQKSGFKFQLLKQLTEIDRRYKQGVLEYKENIQTYNSEIEKLRNKIALERKSYDEEEKSLLMMEHELLFEMKAYEKLQIKFSGYINSIEELKNDYKDVLDELYYESTLKRKEREVLELLEDIESSELTLLNKELLRLTVLETCEPKEKLLNSLKMALKELEMEKAYFESMGLDKSSHVQLENKSFWRHENSEVVDTIEIDSDK